MQTGRQPYAACLQRFSEPGSDPTQPHRLARVQRIDLQDGLAAEASAVQIEPGETGRPSSRSVVEQQDQRE